MKPHTCTHTHTHARVRKSEERKLKAYSIVTYFNFPLKLLNYKVGRGLTWETDIDEPPLPPKTDKRRLADVAGGRSVDKNRVCTLYRKSFQHLSGAGGPKSFL